MQHLHNLTEHRDELISSVKEDVRTRLTAPLTPNELPNDVTYEIIMKMVEDHDTDSIRTLYATNKNMSRTIEGLGGVETLVYNAIIPYTFILIQGLTTPERALAFEQEYATFLASKEPRTLFRIPITEEIQNQASKDLKTVTTSDHPWTRYRWTLSNLGPIGLSEGDLVRLNDKGKRTYEQNKGKKRISPDTVMRIEEDANSDNGKQIWKVVDAQNSRLHDYYFEDCLTKIG
jgi:hypothetical protein